MRKWQIQDFKMYFLLFNFLSHEEKFADAFEILVILKIYFSGVPLWIVFIKYVIFSYLDLSPKITCEPHLMFADTSLLKIAPS